MDTDIIYKTQDDSLEITEFMNLARAAWKRAFDDEETINKFRGAITKTINITARLEDSKKESNTKLLLVGCIRVLTDGYFSTIPEMMVHPQYQHKGIGKKLLHLAAEAAPGKVFFGSQPGNEPFFEKCGAVRGLQSFTISKDR